MDENNQHIIESLRKGEVVTCEKCKKGEYKTSAKDKSISHEFRCNNCGSVIRVTPNVIVE